MDKQYSVYRTFDADGNLLYVGMSGNVANRLCNHMYTSVWYDKMTRFEITKYETREQGLAAEKNAIIEEKPIHNTAHSKPPRIHLVTCRFSNSEIERMELFMKEKGCSKQTADRSISFMPDVEQEAARRLAFPAGEAAQ